MFQRDTDQFYFYKFFKFFKKTDNIYHALYDLRTRNDLRTSPSLPISLSMLTLP